MNVKTGDGSETSVSPIGSLRTDVTQQWREPVMKRLNELCGLPLGWDGYEGIPVTFENAFFALEMLEACCRGDDPIPQIVPGTNGDLQIEWHLEKGAIELHVLAPNDVHAWYADEQNGFEGEELSLTTDFNAVIKWIKNLTEPTRAAVAAAS